MGGSEARIGAEPESPARIDDADVAAYLYALTEGDGRATLLVRPNLTVLWMNAAAEALIDTDPGVSIMAGKLTLVGKAGHEDLATRMELAARMETVGSPPAAWAVQTGVDNHLLVFSATMLAPSGREAVIGLSMRSGRPGGSTWVGIADAFRMTPSEMRVLNALLGGRTAEQLAADQGISIETSRTHIKRIYGKLGVSSREGLFARLMPFQFL